MKNISTLYKSNDIKNSETNPNFQITNSSNRQSMNATMKKLKLKIDKEKEKGFLPSLQNNN